MKLLTRRNLALVAAVAATAALTAGALIASTSPAGAVQSGAKAPNFTAVDSKGVSHALADYSGKTVVLEWTNDGCPYVKKVYGSGDMQALQKSAAADGVVWLTVISSAPGKQGYISGAKADALTAKRGAAPTAVLFDPTGAVGKAYGAKTTPHMYVIKGDGTLAYQGGFDDQPTPFDAPGTPKNYVRLALADVKAGRTVGIPTSKPYGCSIKYAE